MAYNMGMIWDSWLRAGFTDADLKLGRPVSPGRIFVPSSIRLKGQAIHWDREDFRTAEPSKAMLTSFVELWREPGDRGARRILNFAKRWGVLCLDENEDLIPYWPEAGTESIEAWRFYSRKASAILTLATGFRRRDSGSDTEWKALGSVEGKPKAPSRAFEGLGFYRLILGGEVRHWLRSGGLSLSLQHGSAFGWTIELDYNGHLMAAIALQLALTLAHSALYMCGACGLPFQRDLGERQPNRGQRAFCGICGRKAAVRQADHRRRAKMAQARRLHAEGVSEREIQRTLGVRKVATVKGWLKAR